MPKQTVKYGMNFLVIVLSFLVILAVVNYFSYSHFKRLDLTENKSYTITDSTKKILSNLKDNVSIKAYFSETLPPNVATLKKDIIDLLQEYSAYSKGKLRIEFIDPTGNEQIESKLMMQGIQKIPVKILENEKLEITNVYLSLMVEYLDKSQVIPFVQAENLEYDLSGAILKVLADKEQKIAVLFNPDESEKDFEENYSVLQEYLRKQCSITKIDTKMMEYGLREIDTLIIVGPKDFTERELYLIDQFVMRGGRLIALVDSIKLAKGTMMPLKKNPNIIKLLDNYGVKVNEDLVLEYNQRARGMASFNMGYMAVTLPYPFYVKILPGGYSKNHPIVSRLTEVVMPWASSISFKDPLPIGIEKVELLKTSDSADHQTDNFDINPQKRFAPQKKEDLKQFILAGILSGKFMSYFKDKEIPARSSEAEGQPPQKDATPKIESAEKPAQILVVGNSRFAEDRRCFQQTFSGFAISNNGKLFLNAVDWMTVGGELINIRTREIEARPLRELSDSQMKTYRFFGTFGISAIVIVLSFVRIFLKRSRRKKLEGIYISNSSMK